MTLLHVKHSRKEFFDQDEVRDKIDLEDLVEEHRGSVEYSLAGACRFDEFLIQSFLVGSDSGEGLGRLKRSWRSEEE